MRVCLCIPPPASPDHPLLGIASLAAVLREAGHEVCILDLNVEWYAAAPNGAEWRKYGDHLWADESVLEWIEPMIRARLVRFFEHGDGALLDVFGLHVTSAGRSVADLVASCIREISPGLPIIAGGPEFFFEPDEIQVPSWATAVFAGESEASLVEWLGSEWTSGRVVEPKPVDLLKTCSPDFNGFPMELYRNRNVLSVETSRGCNNRCGFCDDVRMWSIARSRSHGSIVEQIARAEKDGATHLSLTDSTLNHKPIRFAYLCELLEQSPLTWDGMVQARGMNEDLATAAARSGCKHLFLGVESFQPSVLKRLHKSVPEAGSKRVIEMLAREGIGVNIGLIIAGPPIQSRDEFEADLEELGEVSGLLESVAINPLCIPEGVPLWALGEQVGLHGIESWRFWHAGDGMVDVQRRLSWCAEAMGFLRAVGLCSDMDCRDFAAYYENEMREGRDYFEKLEICDLATKAVRESIGLLDFQHPDLEADCLPGSCKCKVPR